MTFHITETYKILIEHHGFFFGILEYIRENRNILPNNNVIPKDKYLEEYYNYINNLKIKRANEISKIEKALSLENMIFHDFISYESQFHELEYISISEHILQIFQNIYKEYMTPLTDSQYNEFITIMSDYKIKFKESNLLKTALLEEQIDALLSFLLRVEDAIKGTYKTLSYKKDNLASKNASNNTIEKIKEVKKLQKKYIIPIYQFTNNNHKFIQELTELINLLEDRKKLPKLKERLEFYQQLFYIYASRFKPIRVYISKYIEQNEREIYLNISTEKKLNELNDLLYDLQLGNGKKRYVYKIEGVEKIDTIFNNNTNQNYKQKNTKSIPISSEYFQFLSDYSKEELGKNVHTLKIRFYENENYEELQKQKNIQIERQKNFENILVSFDLYIKKQMNFLIENDVDCSETILSFLKDRDWEIGQFQYIIKKFLENNKKQYDFYLKNKKELQHKNIKTSYYGFGIKNKGNKI